jgi:hypothetical protein
LLDIAQRERGEPADAIRECPGAVGTKQYPGAKETENRTDLQTPEERHNDARRREKNQGFLILLRREGGHGPAYPKSCLKAQTLRFSITIASIGIAHGLYLFVFSYDLI